MAERIPAVLGIDLGTSEAKVAAFALDGRLLGIGRAGYTMDTGPGGRAEQDPHDWWAAVSAAVRSLDLSGIDIRAICGTTQGPSLVACDDEGNAVRPAITWQDRRAGDTGMSPAVLRRRLRA